MCAPEGASIEQDNENQNKFAKQGLERFLMIIKEITEEKNEEPGIKRIQLPTKKSCQTILTNQKKSHQKK